MTKSEILKEINAIEENVKSLLDHKADLVNRLANIEENPNWVIRFYKLDKKNGELGLVLHEYPKYEYPKYKYTREEVLLLINGWNKSNIINVTYFLDEDE